MYTARVHRIAASCTRALWLRGYAPAAALLALWLFAIGSWIYWQGSAPSQPRAVLTRGVVLINWNSIGNGPGIGKVRWSLGSTLTVNGMQVTRYSQRPIWSAERASVDLLPVLRRGHIQLPIIHLAVMAMVPPLLAAWRRRRSTGADQCTECGYDLRGTSGPCPECGTTRVGAT